MGEDEWEDWQRDSDYTTTTTTYGRRIPSIGEDGILTEAGRLRFEKERERERARSKRDLYGIQ